MHLLVYDMLTMNLLVLERTLINIYLYIPIYLYCLSTYLTRFMHLGAGSTGVLQIYTCSTIVSL